MRLNSREYSPIKVEVPMNQSEVEESSLEKSSNSLVSIDDKFEEISFSKDIFAQKTAQQMEVQTDERKEQAFIQNPSYKAYLHLVRDFDRIYMNANQSKFFYLDNFIINPSADEIPLKPDESKLEGNREKLEAWHEKISKEYRKDEKKTQTRVEKRDEKIAEKGKGVGGHLTNVVLRGKTAAYYTKNNLCLRGNMFKLNNMICGKSILEMLPRYGSRKGRHVAVRICQFTLNYLIMAAGYGASPATFGASIIAAEQLEVLITLTGEVLALKLDGAQKRKLVSHAMIRGAELEVLRIPVVGTIANYVENGIFGVGALGIVTTTLADFILEAMSTRYTSSISLDDLGNPHVLFEMNQRIDYLSRFLLPYGQYLLFNETDLKRRTELKKVLKSHFQLLKSLEHKTIKALNFYRLALMANRVPPSVRDDIEDACRTAETNIRMHSNKTARKCLATLINQPGQ